MKKKLMVIIGLVIAVGLVFYFMCAKKVDIREAIRLAGF